MDEEGFENTQLWGKMMMGMERGMLLFSERFSPCYTRCHCGGEGARMEC